MNVTQEYPGVKIEVVWTLEKKGWGRSRSKGSNGNGSAGR